MSAAAPAVALPRVRVLSRALTLPLLFVAATAYHFLQSRGHATPTVFDDRVYSVGVRGRFQCRDANSGELQWEHDLVAEYGAVVPRWGTAFSPLVDGDLVFTNPGGSNASVMAFDRKTGKVAWKAFSDKPGYSSPIAVTLDGERLGLRVDGLWGARYCPILWKSPGVLIGQRWRIPRRKLACGREPLAVRQAPSPTRTYSTGVGPLSCAANCSGWSASRVNDVWCTCSSAKP